MNKQIKLILSFMFVCSCALSLSLMSQIAHAAQVIPDGEYVILASANDNFVLDVVGGKKDTGTNVQLFARKDRPNNGRPVFDCATDPNHCWRFKYDSRQNAYSITGTLSGKYLGVKGDNVELSNQVAWWEISKSGDTYTFKLKGNNKVMDAKGGKATYNTNIGLYNSNNTSAQKWYV